MRSIYNYDRHSKELVKKLGGLEGVNDEVASFVEKYNIWWAYFEEVLKISEENVSPKIHSLVASVKVIALCGMAEDFIKSRKDPAEKFNLFLNSLQPEEKLLFSLAFSSKASIDKEAAALIKKYEETKDEEDFNDLLKLTHQRDDEYHAEVGEIMDAFLKDDFEKINKFFKTKVDLLYGIRSKIVHQGSPSIIGAMLSSGAEAVMFYGERRDAFFTIKYPLEEFFIRAAFRSGGHTPPLLDPTEFLWDEFISRHAPSIARIGIKIKGPVVS